MDKLSYITGSNIIKIHDDLIKVSGGIEGILNPNMHYIIESARHNINQDLKDISSYLLAHIAKGHPFNDGNKRTAYFASRFFLMKNGADFNGNNPQEVSSEIESVAQQPTMDDAMKKAKEIAEEYIVKSPIIPDYESFSRLVIKSIGVAKILANK